MTIDYLAEQAGLFSPAYMLDSYRQGAAAMLKSRRLATGSRTVDPQIYSRFSTDSVPSHDGRVIRAVGGKISRRDFHVSDLGHDDCAFHRSWQSFAIPGNDSGRLILRVGFVDLACIVQSQVRFHQFSGGSAGQRWIARQVGGIRLHVWVRRLNCRRSGIRRCRCLRRRSGAVLARGTGGECRSDKQRRADSRD